MTDEQSTYSSTKEIISENQKVIDQMNEQLARKAQENRVIQQISQEINSSLNLNDILDKILHAMDNVLGFTYSMILLADAEQTKLTLSISRGYNSSGIGAEVLFGQGIIGIVAKRKRIVRMGNIGTGMAYSAVVKSRMVEAGQTEGMTETVVLPGLPNVQSQIGIPLLIKDRLIGVFSVESTEPSAFDALDEMVLMILANQAASVIDNARLYKALSESHGELNEAYASLKDLNESLESQVHDRTEKLSSVLEEVSREKQRSMELLKRTVPEEVIPLILQDQLKARKLHSTILFADLEGFTNFTSGMEPDEIFAQLNFFFGQSGEHIHTFRGYVNKTNGDAIMALFAVPSPNATHAIDAVLAALRMQEEIKDHHSLNMRIGINTGTITAGLLGPENKIQYDVLGDAVNVASRMEKLSRSGGVTITEQTFKMVEPYFNIKSLGLHEVKGKGPTQAYEVIGVKQLKDDCRRIDETSLFAKDYLDETWRFVQSIKDEKLQFVDLLSVQSRDGALIHNESVACYVVALVRYIKQKMNLDAAIVNLSEARLKELSELSEEDLVLIALLHDLGKHAMEPSLLNHHALDNSQSKFMSEQMRDHTISALEQLELDNYNSILIEFYKFQLERGSHQNIQAISFVLAICDMYDALTAPKLYKGRPWSVQGVLEEIVRLSYPSDMKLMVTYFVELMKPEEKEIKLTPNKAAKMFK